MKFTLPFSIVLFALSSFAGPTKIIGIHPLVKVFQDGSNAPVSMRPYLDAFGMIRRPLLHRGVCTATHLGNGYALTAGHCFNHDLKVSEVLVNQPCTGNEVHWGGRNEVADEEVDYPDAYLISKCTRLIYSERIVKTVRVPADEANDSPAHDEEVPIRDFAIFQVSPFPQVAIAPAIEALAYGTSLMSFSYPQHRPLEMSTHCITSQSLRSPFMFWHQCDSEGGSSGASMIAVNAQGIPEVVGIHNGNEKDPIPFNYATYFSAAREALLSRGMNLDKMISGIQVK